MSDKDILKMYDLVFEDIVKNYIEDKEYDRQMKLNISESDIKSIAHNLIYKSEYLWEVINEHIYNELSDRDYTFYEDFEEDKEE
ncbi:hypothetical protein IKS57_02995 [bacterium]|nr:hypothetical protein [bacterium]